MKLQITVNDIPMSGYTYINPQYGQDISNLDNVASDNECIEIFADKIIDHIPIMNMFNIISAWCKKLRHGGKIILGGTDSYELARNYLLGNVDTITYNKAIYGTQDAAWNIKRSCISLKDLVDLLQQLGLKIKKKRLDGVQMVVEAQRD